MTEEATEYKIVMRGIGRLLMNRYTIEAAMASMGVKGDNAEPEINRNSPEWMESLLNQWRGTCLWDKETGLFIPGAYIEACLRDAGSSIKLKGHATMKKAVQSDIMVSVDKIPLSIKGVKVESLDDIFKMDKSGGPVLIDKRVVRVPPRTGARVPRFRVSIPSGWEMTFNIMVEDGRTISKNMLMELFGKAGRVGIGDYRPKFGKFELVSIEEV